MAATVAAPPRRASSAASHTPHNRHTRPTGATAPVAVRCRVIRRSPRRRAPRATRRARPPRSPDAGLGSPGPDVVAPARRAAPAAVRCTRTTRRSTGSRSRRISAAASSRSSTGVIVEGLSPTRAARSRCDGASPVSRAASTAAAVGVRPCRAASRRWCRATAAPTRGRSISSGPDVDRRARVPMLHIRNRTSANGAACVPFGNERRESTSGRPGRRAGCSGDLSSGDPGVDNGADDRQRVHSDARLRGRPSSTRAGNTAARGCASCATNPPPRSRPGRRRRPVRTQPTAVLTAVADSDRHRGVAPACRAGAPPDPRGARRQAPRRAARRASGAPGPAVRASRGRAAAGGAPTLAHDVAARRPALHGGRRGRGGVPARAAGPRAGRSLRTTDEPRHRGGPRATHRPGEPETRSGDPREWRCVTLRLL